MMAVLQYPSECLPLSLQACYPEGPKDMERALRHSYSVNKVTLSSYVELSARACR